MSKLTKKQEAKVREDSINMFIGKDLRKRIENNDVWFLEIATKLHQLSWARAEHYDYDGYDQNITPAIDYLLDVISRNVSWGGRIEIPGEMPKYYI